MITRQISVFAENKPGSLARVTGILAREKINIRATTIATSDTFGVINLIVDDPDRAFKALTREGVMATMKDVIAVVIDDKPGGLDKLTQCLFKENININNAYGFVLESWKTAVFVLDVDQKEKTVEVLKQKGFKMLDTDALSSLEPFHYIKY
ncbi:MAG TPA: ACT domain-containing protein [Syntrophales bacterium]|nr:ACT domain-containing protein [Syntrophobacterales bacterium]HRR40018.1 ACT domain-containing protein [Syntrophales bacterium]HRT26711.1 ACT domain-containing protein [Syntrophales bacterium]HRT70670.1 ACT domain-containing protein [Syntrophales bacterium]